MNHENCQQLTPHERRMRRYDWLSQRLDEDIAQYEQARLIQQQRDDRVFRRGWLLMAFGFAFLIHLCNWFLPDYPTSMRDAGMIAIFAIACICVWASLTLYPIHRKP